MFDIFFFNKIHKLTLFYSQKPIGQCGGASRWRVCYQRGLPRTVFPASAPGPIQSISWDICLCVWLCFCLCHCQHSLFKWRRLGPGHHLLLNIFLYTLFVKEKGHSLATSWLVFFPSSPTWASSPTWSECRDVCLIYICYVPSPCHFLRPSDHMICTRTWVVLCLTTFNVLIFSFTKVINQTYQLK